MALNPQPYNINIPDIGQTFMTAFEKGQKTAQKQRKQQQQQLQKQEALSALYENPTTENILRAGQFVPEYFKHFKDINAGLSEAQQQDDLKRATEIYNTIDKNPDHAYGVIHNLKLAHEKAGDIEKANEYENMLEMAKTDTKLVKSIAGSHMMAIMGHDKFSEFSKRMQDISESKKLQQQKLIKWMKDNEYTEAQIAKEKKEAEKIGAETKLKQLEYKKKANQTGITLSKEGEKLLNNTVIEQSELNMITKQFSAIADEFDDAISSGIPAKVAEKVKKEIGAEDRITYIRKIYGRLKNMQVIKLLPQGPSTDKDIEITRSVFPDETSNPLYIASFLRGIAKLNRYESKILGVRAEWLSQLGSLKSSDKEIIIDGEVIPKGTAFNDAVKMVVKFPPAIAEWNAGKTAGKTTGATEEIKISPKTKKTIRNVDEILTQ